MSKQNLEFPFSAHYAVLLFVALLFLLLALLLPDFFALDFFQKKYSLKNLPNYFDKQSYWKCYCYLLDTGLPYHNHGKSAALTGHRSDSLD